jgi:hypothetical protein
MRFIFKGLITTKRPTFMNNTHEVNYKPSLIIKHHKANGQCDTDNEAPESFANQAKTKDYERKMPFMIILADAVLTPQQTDGRTDRQNLPQHKAVSKVSSHVAESTLTVTMIIKIHSDLARLRLRG